MQPFLYEFKSYFKGCDLEQKILEHGPEFTLSDKEIECKND